MSRTESMHVLPRHRAVRWNMPFHGIQYTYANAYLLLDDSEKKALLIDCGWPSCGSWIAEKAKAHLEGFDLQGIFLTHAHLDHVGDAAWLSKHLGAPVIAHRGDADALATGRLSVPKWVFHSKLLGVLTKAVSPRAPKVTPDIWHEGEGEVFGFGKLMPLPGHHQNQTGLILASGDAFVGDAAVIVDRAPAPNSFYDDPKQSEETFRQLCERVRGLAYAGHFRPIDLSRVRSG